MKIYGILAEDFDVGLNGSGANGQPWRDCLGNAQSRAGSVWSDTIQSAAGRMTMTTVPTTNTGSNAIYHARNLVDSTVGDCEILLDLIIDGTGRLGPGAIVMWNGSVASPNGYCVFAAATSSGFIKTVAVVRYDSGTPSTLFTVSPGGSLTSLRVRFRVANGVVALKYWDPSLAESTASGWTRAFDTTYTSGLVGVVTIGTGTTPLVNDYAAVGRIRARRITSDVAAPTVLIHASDNVDRTSYTTASITPAAATKGVVLVVLNRHSTAPTVPTVTGCGMTWTQIHSDVQTNNFRRITVFQGTLATGVAAATTGVLTIDFGGVTQTACLWAVIEMAGMKGGTVGNALTSQVSGVNTKAVPVADTGWPDIFNPIRFTVLAQGATANTITPGSNWTELFEDQSTAPTEDWEMAYSMGTLLQPSNTYTWTTVSSGIAVAFECLPAVSQPARDGTSGRGGTVLSAMGSRVAI